MNWEGWKKQEFYRYTAYTKSMNGLEVLVQLYDLTGRPSSWSVMVNRQVDDSVSHGLAEWHADHEISLEEAVELATKTAQEYTVVVTRHLGLWGYLVQEGIVADGTRVIEHATEDDVRGKRVVGVLPIHLAALAASVVVVPLDIPPELRGVELTTQQVRLYAKPPRTFVVTETTQGVYSQQQAEKEEFKSEE